MNRLGVIILILFFHLDIFSQSILYYNSIADTNKINLVGNSQFSDGKIRLTKSSSGQIGGIWFKEKQNIKDGFTILFSFRISDILSDAAFLETGADGFAFVIQ